MKISEIAFVAYPVIEIERSRGFYEGVLGLPDGGDCRSGWQQDHDP
jgi:extradiol dioxygenase family protein